MNYLSLCKRLRQEAGLSGNGPASVLAQAGESQRIIDWVASAWEELQTMHSDWRFMLSSFSDELPEDLQALNLIPSGFKRIKPYSVYFRRSDGSGYYPEELTPEAMRDMLRRSPSIAGLPRFFSVDGGVMTVYPKPNETLTVEGDYYRAPSKLTGNTDVPEMPDEYHMVIVWLALMQLGGFDESSNTFARAQMKFASLYEALGDTQRPHIEPARPLA